MKLAKSIIEETTELLLNRYKISTRFINIMTKEFGLDSAEKLLNTPLSNQDKLKLILGSQGSQLFVGKSHITTELKKRIIDKWDIEDIEEQFKLIVKSNGKSKAHKINNLAKQRWHSGKRWPNSFIRISHFNPVFTGLANETRMKKYDDVEPVIKPPELKEFQLKLKNDLISTLNEKGDKAKCIISLPTGGGKTRTAVEAFVEWLQPRFAEGKYLLWIAQSEELCEQAVASISQIWSNKEFTDSLRIYRMFSSNNIIADDLIGGVIVATINKLYNAIENDNEVVQEIIEYCGAMIIDEAHRAVSPMYETLYSYSSKLKGADMFPICGLTATPGRNHDSESLSKFFRTNLYTPDLGEEYQDNPLKYFRDKNYLALPIHKTIRTNFNISPVRQESEDVSEQFLINLEDEFKKSHNKVLAKNDERNKLIIDTLLSVPEKEMSIVYTCTVEHAIFLSGIMNYFNRVSVAISSDTRKPLRRKYIEQFKNGEIEFIFNYGVLTTGFDAPKTQNIIICRPTFSTVLYEQIVGRGLRGPEFGGTKTCKIIDFCDNYERFGDQQAYMRFVEFWVKEEP